METLENIGCGLAFIALLALVTAYIVGWEETRAFLRSIPWPHHFAKYRRLTRSEKRAQSIYGFAKRAKRRIKPFPVHPMSRDYNAACDW